MHIFLFFIPGILLVFSKAFNKKPLTEFLIYVIGLSLSFFVVMPWFIKYFNAPLMFSAYIVFMASAVAMVVNIKRINLKNLIIDRQEMILIAVFVIVLLLRCAPMLFQAAPAGGDMSMHSYIARLIYDNDGLPGSYEPLLPISSFGAYPTGFPILSALVSLLCDCPIYRSGLLMTCLTHALFCFGLFALLLRFFDRNTAAASAIAASFLTRSPQWVIRWGGNPTVLALFFFIIALSLAVELKKEPSWLKLAIASLALAAALITNSMVFYSGGTIAGVKYALFELLSVAPFLILLFFGLPMLVKKNKSSVISKLVDAQKMNIFIAVSLIGFVYYSVFYLYPSISMCSVTRADIDAFKWMDSTLSKSAVIKNNYGDAGLWIPAIIGRAVTNPHDEPVHGEELKTGLAKLKADYIYIGSKAIYGVELKKEDLEKAPWKYRRVFSNDGAQVWKVL